MHTPRVFVSFSVTGDAPGRDFVRQLVARLNAQALQAWVYESPAGAIPAGASIALTCRQQIDACDFFIVFVSDRALTSAYVAMETSHALWVSEQRALPIYPIVSTTTPRDDWPPAIAQATGYRGRQVVHGQTGALESIVLDVCLRMGVAHRPPKPTNMRLPLARRLADELAQRTAKGSHDMGDHARLLQLCDTAVDLLERGDQESAWACGNALLVDLRFNYGFPDSYYPKIFVGATMLARAQAGQAGYAEAERWFADLIQQQPQSADASAHAGRGNALLAQGAHGAAIDCFWQAAACLDAPDPALLYNVVRAHVMAGLPIDQAQLRARSVAVDDGLVTRQPGDRSRIAAVQMLSHAHAGDWRGAQQAWAQVEVADDVFPEVVVDTCHCLCNRAHASVTGHALVRAALAILQTFRAGTARGTDARFCMLEHTEARLHRDAGDVHRASRMINALAAAFPLNPVLAVDAAMFAIDNGDRRMAHAHCMQATHLHSAGDAVPAVSPDQFEFALAQAFWLLGRAAESTECFRRSRAASDGWFAHTLPALWAAAATADGQARWPRQMPGLH